MGSILTRSVSEAASLTLRVSVRSGNSHLAPRWFMNEEEIFHQALARNLPEERAAYLHQACAGNPALRSSVERLLQANVGASGFLDGPAPALLAPADEGNRERPGAVIGSYKLLEQI